MKPLGLGMIGLHHQHPRWYYPLWKQLTAYYEPRAIADSDRPFLQSEADEVFTGLDTYEDYQGLLARDDIDVVIIWLPHSEMPSAVAHAVEAGKHVMVEKPCAADVEGARQIAQLQKNHPEVLVSSPYCWPNHPVSKRLGEELRNGAIGRVTAIEARLNAGGPERYIRDNASWMLDHKEGGGPLWNLGVHWIEYIRKLAGLTITEIAGTVSRTDGGPERSIEDNAQAVLGFDNGAAGILDISYGLTPDYPGNRDIYFALRGEHGAASWAPAWSGNKDELLLVNSNADDTHRCRRIEIESTDVEGYAGFMGWDWLKRFAESIHMGTEPDVTVDDILYAVRAAAAFYRSVESGRFECVE